MEKINEHQRYQKPLSLLKKFNIPINHLDFNYIENCKNVEEIEKIVEILKSCEEGYYPDLTRCAVSILMRMKPNSKILREEIPLLTKHRMPTDDWDNLTNTINKWTDEMKEKDDLLRKNEEHNKNKNNCIDLPPIRKPICNNSDSIIESGGGGDGDSKNNNNNKLRICDYNKWDKYDADTELLKMDIQEERIVENTIKERNKKKPRDTVLIEEIETFNIDKLTLIEKQEFSNKYRINGNDFYKTTEYQAAIIEYTKSIKMQPTANAFNNRAMAYLKSREYKNAINDCNNCLKIDPQNIKALFRKAQCHVQLDDKENAYNLYSKILTIEPKNKIALDKFAELKTELKMDMPPANAFRMKIVDNVQNPTINEFYPKIKEDHSELIKPNKVINKDVAKMDAMLKDTMNSIKTEFKNKKKQLIKDSNSIDNKIKILPNNNENVNRKCTTQKNLIEEI